MSYFFTTDRLGFRYWTADDLPLATALWTDPGVMAHMGGPMSPEGFAERLGLEMSRQGTFGIQYWPLFWLASGEHAGCAGLRPFHEHATLLELGVHIARPFWSVRLGEEAGRAVIEWAWQHTAAAALVAGHGPDNVHSKALIGRLGFTYTHLEPWGTHSTLHPFYRLDRPNRE